MNQKQKQCAEILFSLIKSVTPYQPKSTSPSLINPPTFFAPQSNPKSSLKSILLQQSQGITKPRSAKKVTFIIQNQKKTDPTLLKSKKNNQKLLKRSHVSYQSADKIRINQQGTQIQMIKSNVDQLVHSLSNKNHNKSQSTLDFKQSSVNFEQLQKVPSRIWNPEIKNKQLAKSIMLKKYRHQSAKKLLGTSQNQQITYSTTKQNTINTKPTTTFINLNKELKGNQLSKIDKTLIPSNSLFLQKKNELHQTSGKKILIQAKKQSKQKIRSTSEPQFHEKIKSFNQMASENYIDQLNKGRQKIQKNLENTPFLSVFDIFSFTKNSYTSLDVNPLKQPNHKRRHQMDVEILKYKLMGKIKS